MNSLYGIYVERGVIDTSATLEEVWISDLGKLSKTEQGARVADLLKSRSGVFHPAAAESPVMVARKPDRHSAKPGERYYYNNWDFNTLDAIFEQKTSLSIFEAFNKEIAEPLGMLHYQGTHDTVWVRRNEEEIPDTDGFYQFNHIGRCTRPTTSKCLLTIWHCMAPFF